MSNEQTLTVEEVKSILSGDSDYKKMDEPGCSTLKGLNIIAKYCPNNGVDAAWHDQIWGAEVENAIKNGLTRKDAETLRDLNWFVDDGAFSSFA